MSAITVSGFNNIDFNQILNALMTQERAPLTVMQARQLSLKAQSSAFAALATKLGALEAASSSLTGTSVLQDRTVTTSDATVVTAEAGAGAAVGTYDVLVRELARSQVTAATSHHADRDTTIIAAGGTLTIGGASVTLSGDTTLQGLADAINATADVGVVASIVRDADGYRLVLTGTMTGTDAAFTVANGLTGSSLTFADGDANGISGDSATDNAMQAVDADLLINNVAVTSATNTVEDAIPGVTLALNRTSPDRVVSVRVAEDGASTRTLVDAFVTAYNDLVDFAQAQVNATNGIGRDPLLRSLRSELRAALSAQYAAGGDVASLAVAGVGFDQTGKLIVEADRFDAALADSDEAVRALFAGDGSNEGVFSTVEDILQRYTGVGALLAEATDRIDDQVRALDGRLAAMEVRLASRRDALQRQFAATDSLMSQLNSQLMSLQSLGTQYSLF